MHNAKQLVVDGRLALNPPHRCSPRIWTRWPDGLSAFGSLNLLTPRDGLVVAVELILPNSNKKQAEIEREREANRLLKKSLWEGEEKLNESSKSTGCSPEP